MTEVALTRVEISYLVLWWIQRFVIILSSTFIYVVMQESGYARCTRSVSVVPPAYYAHLAAYRARFYMEPDVHENAKTRCTWATNGSCVRPLRALKEKVKNVMFYC
ncbi:hypothetical protein SO802_030189 [Lithocarpus litseifolius]|uniref:Uncharacterized protein n=1 Tax=Lithocarpus litseifolius TaxID=425828 RepID=A0AAW2BYK6_9ROSI